MNHQLTKAFLLLGAILLTYTISKAQKAITVHGQIVEVKSYVKDGLKPSGQAKKEVVIQALKHGGIFGLLEEKRGILYLLGFGGPDSAFTAMVNPYIGMKSFIKGEYYYRNGTRFILVNDIGKSIK